MLDGTYTYDCNGNMTQRVIGGSTYTLTYDIENRLNGVSGAATATFTYDGDGNRVKGTVAGVTTAYIGNHYELTGSTTRKYYYAGDERVAMRQNSTLYYLLGDHLGSTSVTVEAYDGSVSGELRYKPYGDTRHSFGNTPTTFRFTGQRVENAIGLYFYNARWYDPKLGRFIQADTIVPEPGNPQTLNRYSYVFNNPVRYTDPSGHAGETPCAGFCRLWSLLNSPFAAVVQEANYWWNPLTVDPIESPRATVTATTGNDITPWLVGEMVSNASGSAAIRQAWRSDSPIERDASARAWVALVSKGGIWDYKADVFRRIGPEVTLGGRTLGYEAVANIHFGFVGLAAGFSPEFLRSGAGLAQIKDNWRSPENIGPAWLYFDQDFDRWAVDFGMYLYGLYFYRLGELTEDAFAASLEQYISKYGEPPE